MLLCVVIVAAVRVRLDAFVVLRHLAHEGKRVRLKAKALDDI